MSTSTKRDIRPNKKSRLSETKNYIIEMMKMEGYGWSQNTPGKEIQLY